MGKFTFHPVKSLQSDPKLRMLCLFGIVGFLLQYAVSLYSLANNLYATNLGATDTQIGLVQMVPNMVAGICMIPVGFLANRTKTSRTVPYVLALFLSYSMLNVCDLSTDGCFTLGATVGADSARPCPRWTPRGCGWKPRPT